MGCCRCISFVAAISGYLTSPWLIFTPPPTESYERFGCRKGHNGYPFCNTNLSVEERVDDLISRLTLDEKPWLLEARAAPRGNISRLGIPAYGWGANCVHGVRARCGRGSRGEWRCPTVFPSPVGLGASFNETIWRNMAQVLAIELRSLWRQGIGENRYDFYVPVGLDCWSPTINVARDPRWGRQEESPSEDPYVLSRFAVSIAQRLQNGPDDRYLLAVTTLKHFAVYSLEGTWTGPGGPRKYPGKGPCVGGKCDRHTLDVRVSAYDLASTYLTAFKAGIMEGGALGVMCSYNSVNGVPACGNKWLLNETLRKAWKFKGYVTTDSSAVHDMAYKHFYSRTELDAAGEAVAAGSDIISGDPHEPKYLNVTQAAVHEGKLSERALDNALKHTLSLRFRLGLFDPPNSQSYTRYSGDNIQRAEHVQASKEAAEQSLVLLKNDEVRKKDGSTQHALPIASGRTALIGPLAADRDVLLGSYVPQTCPDRSHDCVQSVLEALRARVDVVYAQGLSGTTSHSRSLFDEAVRVTEDAEQVVLCLGTGKDIEGEMYDRRNISLPPMQLQLFDAVQAIGKPVIVLLMNGGVLAIDRIKKEAAAIVEAWYPGFYGADVIARALLGLTNRWGKLPVTMYSESFGKEFNMIDFEMTKAPGRTYRYYTGTPLWPFGFGLSYTNFLLTLHSKPEVRLKQFHGTAIVQVEVWNAGSRDGDEVVMAFFVPYSSTLPKGCKAALLRRQLFAFERVSVEAGATVTVAIEVQATSFAVYADSGDRVSYAGDYEVQLSNGLQTALVKITLEGDGRNQPHILDHWVPDIGGNAKAAKAVLQA